MWHITVRHPLPGCPTYPQVKMVRVIRGALMLDDGHGAEELSQMRDAWAHMG